MNEQESHCFFDTYKRIPLDIVRGEGVYLFTKDGKRYLDMFAGLAVNSLGYGNPKVIRAIEDQVRKYIHLSNYYFQESQLQLAELLIKHSGYAKIFFSNSGTEATEGAIKLTRKWGSKICKTDIISFSNAFHGRSMGALSMMDKLKYREEYEPFLENFKVIEFNNVKAFREAITQKTAAVFLEFIQGEGGVNPVTPELVDEIRILKNKFNFLLVADEIQCGIGRTAKFFSFQHFNINPDVVLVAKPIGGGLPLGAILGNSVVAGVFEPGNHGTTFGGNPVACAAGVSVIKEIMEGGILENGKHVGEFLKSKLLQLKEKYPSLVKDVRGIGLMLGMELSCDGDPIIDLLREKQILLNCTNKNVIRFLPPLIIGEDHVNETVQALDSIFSDLI